ncbi:MAG: 4Fe-4S binding protein [Anaerolineae bacterium]|nr:4Fe-4S binding protein [Anaerolineae bacterium]
MTHSTRETQDSQWLPRIDSALCTGCGDCVTLCPVDALGMVGGKAVLAVPDACTYCTACEDACPVEAIALPFLICLADDLRPGSVSGTNPEERAQ